MNNQRIVLISQRLIPEESYEEMREALDTRWGPFLSLCNLLPVPVLSKVSVERYTTTMDISGIILSGGNDLSQCVASPANEERDRVDEGLLTWALSTKTPVLGVCRGAQFLARYFGGIIAPIENHINKEHCLNFQVETAFSCKFAKTQRVNSYHSYGIMSVPRELDDLARAEDQTIEAFTHKTSPILGIMWHPERTLPFAEMDLAIFNNFLTRKL